MVHFAFVLMALLERGPAFDIAAAGFGL